MCKITVFTSTYNRAYIINNLYNSLKKQKFKDFEWLIIDDGSEDDTETIVNKWICEQVFLIRYYKISNGGKHKAINKGVNLAKGKLFFIVDSDDSLTEDALYKINKWDIEINNCKERFAGVVGNKGYTRKRLVGTTFEQTFIDAKSTERGKYNINGDKAEAYYTDILKLYPFPEYEGEKFITERVVWDKIASDGYMLRYYNSIIYLCDYLEDGLTKNGDGLFANNPKGVAHNLHQMIKIYNYNFIEKMRSYNAYIELCGEHIELKDACAILEISVPYMRFSILVARIYRLLKKKKVKRGE